VPGALELPRPLLLGYGGGLERERIRAGALGDALLGAF
jgi:hypothetical protein